MSDHNHILAANATPNIDAEMKDISQHLVSSKLAERQILAESAAAGGPADTHSAIAHMMEVRNIGYRAMSMRVKVPRKKLVGMIEGRIDMPSEVFLKIHEVLYPSKPKQTAFNLS